MAARRLLRDADETRSEVKCASCRGRRTAFDGHGGGGGAAVQQEPQS